MSLEQKSWSELVAAHSNPSESDAGSSDSVITPDVNADEGLLDAGTDATGADPDPQDLGLKEKGLIADLQKERQKAKELKEQLESARQGTPEQFVSYVEDLAKRRPELAKALAREMGTQANVASPSNDGDLSKRLERLETELANTRTREALVAEISKHQVFKDPTLKPELRGVLEREIISQVQSGKSPSEAVEAVAVLSAKILGKDGASEGNPKFPPRVSGVPSVSPKKKADILKIMNDPVARRKLLEDTVFSQE